MEGPRHRPARLRHQRQPHEHGHRRQSARRLPECQSRHLSGSERAGPRLRRSTEACSTAIGATTNFPPRFAKNITVDGEIMKAPVAVHIDGMVYYNKAGRGEAAGVDPKAWKSMDDLFADFDKVKAAGFIPIAQGGDQVPDGLSAAGLDGFRGRVPRSTIVSMVKSRTAP